MRLALKRTARPTIFGPVAHAIGKHLDNGPYSHIELVFSDGMSASACAGEGVRFKFIAYSHPGAWDFWTLPFHMERAAERWFDRHEGEPYDNLGMLRFAFGMFQEDPGKWLCSEAVGAALGWSETWRYSPGGVLARCRDELGAVQVAAPWVGWPS